MPLFHWSLKPRLSQARQSLILVNPYLFHFLGVIKAFINVNSLNMPLSDIQVALYLNWRHYRLMSDPVVTESDEILRTSFQT